MTHGLYCCKIRRSSLATAGQMQKVAAIVRRNPERRYIVLSAPGKAPEFQDKVTVTFICLPKRRLSYEDTVAFEIVSARLRGAINPS